MASGTSRTSTVSPTSTKQTRPLPLFLKLSALLALILAGLLSHTQVSRLLLVGSKQLTRATPAASLTSLASLPKTTKSTTPVPAITTTTTTSISTNPFQRRITIPTHAAMAAQTIQAADGAKLEFTVRPSQERGNADHGWLKTFHTFNFADYYDPRFEKWGSLRVINEDRVEPKEGFGTHGHREFEIFSYIVNGELEHRDSMGNVEVMKRGDVQLTSAGTGIRHSEKTHGSNQVHFLQIWSTPSTHGLPPKYYHRHFTDEDKRQGWIPVVGKEGDEGVTDEREGTGPTPVHSPLWLYATLLGSGKKVDQKLKMNKGYVHVVQTSGYNTGKSEGNKIKINGAVELAEGDGAFITSLEGAEQVVSVENVGEKEAEILLFDLE